MDCSYTAGGRPVLCAIKPSGPGPGRPAKSTRLQPLAPAVMYARLSSSADHPASRFHLDLFREDQQPHGPSCDEIRRHRRSPISTASAMLRAHVKREVDAGHRGRRGGVGDVRQDQRAGRLVRASCRRCTTPANTMPWWRPASRSRPACWPSRCRPMGVAGPLLAGLAAADRHLARPRLGPHFRHQWRRDRQALRATAAKSR